MEEEGKIAEKYNKEEKEALRKDTQEMKAFSDEEMRDREEQVYISLIGKRSGKF